FIEGVLQNPFVPYGTNGVSAAIATLTLTSTDLTAGAAPVGNDAFTVLTKGAWFTVVPGAAATQAVKDYFAGRVFRVSTTTAPTTTKIVLDTATPIDTAKAGVSLAGAKLTSSVAMNGTVMK